MLINNKKVIENFRMVINKYGYCKVQERTIVKRDIKYFRFWKRVLWKDRMMPITATTTFDIDIERASALAFLDSLKKNDIQKQKWEHDSYKESEEHRVFNTDLNKAEWVIIKAHRKMVSK